MENNEERKNLRASNVKRYLHTRDEIVALFERSILDQLRSYEKYKHLIRQIDNKDFVPYIDEVMKIDTKDTEAIDEEIETQSELYLEHLLSKGK